MELIHMTAAYSNAVLVAMLPYVSDFAKALNLPIEQPITTNQIIWSHPSPYKKFIDSALVLTNHDWFEVQPRGFVNGYRAPTNFFYEQEFTDDRIPQYLGKDNMTTNEAVEMARNVLLKLGWSTNITHSDEPPQVRGPYDLTRVKGHVPYCQIVWEWPKGEDTLIVNFNRIQMEINLETKQLVGFALGLSRTNIIKTNPVKIDMVPELESDYQKRRKANGQMFRDANVAPRLPFNPTLKQP